MLLASLIGNVITTVLLIKGTSSQLSIMVRFNDFTQVSQANNVIYDIPEQTRCKFIMHCAELNVLK